ncbi:alpha-N-arabinofuranosidase [Pleomorphovibrio marinus]|uniref:alpha-N-arabinofuranosidase n=1 Tax=Pleomorphovibrio marinus TaxID=2164132 RepID=UPI000E0C9329|nr:alpha-L-arabinofuranosidase C-terminal domain-containing protein [Pleomorphovibrio marinus]
MTKLLPAFIALLFTFGGQALAQSTTVIVNADQGELTIDEHIYGQFSEHLGRGIYEGIWVGPDSEIPNQEGYRTDVLNALKELKIPNIRWPGGCFADEYNWRDGIGPRADRPKRINSHWGGVVEDNSFGTHEFLRLAELIGAEPYISANVGSGTPAEMNKWIEYMTYDGDSELANLRRENGRDEPWKIKFFGIGNESWGCGGTMTADFYANQYRLFQTFAKNYSDNRLFKIASGSNDIEYEWTETLMREAVQEMDAISLHYYTIPGQGWDNKGPSTDFGEEMYYRGIKAGLLLDEFITRHKTVMDRYDPEKKVVLALDEWGIWTNPLEGTNPGFLEQQNTIRDALIASLSLDIMNSHADRVKLANIAQTVNVLQAMVLTEGSNMLLTPTYHVFNMYKVHHNATLLPVYANIKRYTTEWDKPVVSRFDLKLDEPGIPVISHTVSKDEDGKIHLTVSNLHPNDTQEVTFEIRGATVNKILQGSAKLLTGNSVDAINTFDNPEQVQPEAFRNAELKNGKLTLKIPKHSLVVISLE